MRLVTNLTPWQQKVLRMMKSQGYDHQTARNIAEGSSWPTDFDSQCLLESLIRNRPDND